MSYRFPSLAAAAATLALTLSMAATAAQGQPAGDRHPPKPPSATELQRELGLDAAKAEQVAALMARHGEARQQLHERHRGEMEALLSPEQLRQLKRGQHGHGGRQGPGAERQR